MTEHNVTEYFKSEANSKTIPDKTRPSTEARASDVT